MTTATVDIAIVGNGPAGAVAGLLDRFPLPRRIPGRIGLEVRRERVRSPRA